MSSEIIKLQIGNYFNVVAGDVVASYLPDGTCVLLACRVPALRIMTDATDWLSKDTTGHTRTKVDLAWAEATEPGRMAGGSKTPQ